MPSGLLKNRISTGDTILSDTASIPMKFVLFHSTEPIREAAGRVYKLQQIGYRPG